MNQRSDLESEDVEVCTSPHQLVSNVNVEASRPEPQEPSTIFECKEEFGDIE